MCYFICESPHDACLPLPQPLSDQEEDEERSIAVTHYNNSDMELTLTETSQDMELCTSANKSFFLVPEIPPLNRDCHTVEPNTEAVEFPIESVEPPIQTVESMDLTMEPEDLTIEPEAHTIRPELHAMEPEVLIMEPGVHTMKPAIHIVKPVSLKVRPETKIVQPVSPTLLPRLQTALSTVHTMETKIQCVQPPIQIKKDDIHEEMEMDVNRNVCPQGTINDGCMEMDVVDKYLPLEEGLKMVADGGRTPPTLEKTILESGEIDMSICYDSVDVESVYVETNPVLVTNLKPSVSGTDSRIAAMLRVYPAFHKKKRKSPRRFHIPRTIATKISPTNVSKVVVSAPLNKRRRSNLASLLTPSRTTPNRRKAEVASTYVASTYVAATKVATTNVEAIDAAAINASVTEVASTDVAADGDAATDDGSVIDYVAASDDATASDVDSASDDVASDDVASDDVVSDDVASDDVASDDAASDDTASDDVASDDTASDVAATDDVASDDTASDDAASNVVASDVVASDDAASDVAATDDVASDDAASHVPASHVTNSHVTITAITAIEDNLPDVAATPVAATDVTVDTATVIGDDISGVDSNDNTARLDRIGSPEVVVISHPRKSISTDNSLFASPNATALNDTLPLNSRQSLLRSPSIFTKFIANAHSNDSLGDQTILQESASVPIYASPPPVKIMHNSSSLRSNSLHTLPARISPAASTLSPYVYSQLHECSSATSPTNTVDINTSTCTPHRDVSMLHTASEATFISHIHYLRSQ